MPVLLLELNEVNFNYLLAYIERGELPHIARLVAAHGFAETTSEQRYEELEPWIQWVTAHTGLPYARHKIFRLGDVVKHDLAQVWEAIEDHGLRAGAISPMNANNRMKHPAFFVPDPWTPTRFSGPPLLRRLYEAIAQAVNDNAQGRLTLSSATRLLASFSRYARPANYAEYSSLAVTGLRKAWRKAMLLDLLLADVFVRETRRTKPDFASLFLNAAAHIQHHYMFNSAAYQGSAANPLWYVDPKDDPVGEVYRLYDKVVGQIQKAIPEARLIIATGLHQDPHAEVTYYWRLKDHSAFLRKLGVPFHRVEPRMSRDFLVECGSAEDAAAAERILASARAESGLPLFEVDNRGSDLFVMLTWPEDVPPDFVYHVGERRMSGLRDDIAFVAIKNGQHNGIGYFLDTGTRIGELPSQFPLSELPSHICSALGVKWKEEAREAAWPVEAPSYPAAQAEV